MKRAFKHSIAKIPMMAPTRDRIALAMRMAAENMAMAPSSAVATEVSRLLAIMTASMDYVTPKHLDVRADPVWLAIVAANEVMQAAEARHDAGQNYGVTGDQLQALRAAAAQFDAALRRIPFNVWEAARVWVDELLTTPATT